MERIVVQSDGTEGKLHGSTYYPLIDCCNMEGETEICQMKDIEKYVYVHCNVQYMKTYYLCP